MANSTLLQLVQDTANELGLTAPTAVVTATDQQTIQLNGLINRCGRILLADNSWSILTKLFAINAPEPTAATGVVTEGSAIITGIGSTTGLSTAFSVSGEGIPNGARVYSVDSATQVTLNVPCTSNEAASSLLFAKDTYAQPADWHSATKRTQWDRTNYWELQGPVSPQQYQWLVSGITATGPRRKYRIEGNNIVIWPPPSSADTPATMTMEYCSSYWVLSDTGTAKPRFTADTDTCLFDDDLMVMGLKWLFFQVKGFEYTELRRQWQNQASIFAGEDGGAQTLDMTGRTWPIFITPANVQDGNWPGT